MYDIEAAPPKKEAKKAVEDVDWIGPRITAC